MKLLILADLHYGQSSEQNAIVEKFVKSIPQTLDGIILCGDICNDSYTQLSPCLNLFQDFKNFKAFVPGNHDLFCENQNTSYLYSHNLPQTALENIFHPLFKHPHKINKTGFCGTIGWYDGSFKDPSCLLIDPLEYQEKTLQTGEIWQDKKYIQWGKEDSLVTAEMVLELENQIVILEKECDQILCFSHHLFSNHLLEFKPHDPIWSFKRYFMGSVQFSNMLKKHPKVTHVFSGHCHLNRKHQSHNCIHQTLFPFDATSKIEDFIFEF